MKTLTPDVRLPKEPWETFARVCKSGKSEKTARIGFATLELLWKVLTAKRWELLKALCGAGPVSIRKAARRVNRDVKAVHSDVTALLDAGVIDRSDDGRIIFSVRGDQGRVSSRGCLILLRLAVAFAFATLMLSSFSSLAKPTKLCNPTQFTQLFLYTMPESTQSRLVNAVNHPEQDKDLYDRLWQPLRASSSTLTVNYTAHEIVYLDFEPVQDLDEIVLALRADPVIATLGIQVISVNRPLCFSVGYPPNPQLVTEYYNTTLDHYFLSSTPAENAYIDAGKAGPGWVRTGESFRTNAVEQCHDNTIDNVFRFYGKGPNSHFYTVSTSECGGLRSENSGWQVEGPAFGAVTPKDGACEFAYLTPVYRLYNNRWMFNDSNHRYTIRQEIYEQMIAKGWIGEGVALCVPNGP